MQRLAWGDIVCATFGTAHLFRRLSGLRCDDAPGSGVVTPLAFVSYGVVGVKAAPSARYLGGVLVPAGVPISPPQTISARPVHATVEPPRARNGERGIDDQRFVRGS